MRVLSRLVRPRLSLLNGVTAAAGYLLYPAEVDAVPLAGAAAGVTLLAAGGSALNQVMECDLDRLMARTSSRPLPRGELGRNVAALTSGVLILAGYLTLFCSGGFLPALLGVAALAWYLVIYTPLKRRSPFALPLGALCGAVPPVIGWCLAGGAPGDYRVILLAGFFYLWQIPHFWLLQRRHEEEYRAAGIPLVSAIFRKEGSARLIHLWFVALAAGAMLLPLSTVAGGGIPLWYPLSVVTLLAISLLRPLPAVAPYLTLYPLLMTLFLVIR